MNITEFIKENTLVLDGGMGTLLQARGLPAGENPALWSVAHPDEIVAIHKAYFDAGAHVVSTNTFGANILKFDNETLQNIVAAAVKNAKDARALCKGDAPRFVALDIGPTGRMLKPYGDLDFEDAVAVFAETVRLGVAAGVDLILIETMSDSYETKAALLAAKENSTLPVFVCCAFGEDGKLLTGADAPAMVALLEGMGADAVGANCSVGPRALRPVMEALLAVASVPVLCKPNAGLPRVEKGTTVYDVSPRDFAAELATLVQAGVRGVGGCCGTTPEYIATLSGAVKDISPSPIAPKNRTVISSYTHALCFGENPVLIGERINPTGKPRFKEALRTGDIDYILREGIAQEERGVHALDVNVGLPEIDETKMLTDAVCALQAVCDLPLQIDTANPAAMEAALRRYNGKPLINSVNGKKESMETIFPLAKKYGGVVIALTLDDGGIPATAEGRLAIARNILATAGAYGLSEKDLIFDPLALTVSADRTAAIETLRAVALIREKMGCHTSLGVSNVSFGLPARDDLNSTFFTLALEHGLSAAIVNPHSDAMLRAYYSYRALHGLDGQFADYIAYAEKLTPSPAIEKTDRELSLSDAIVKGLCDVAAARASEMLRAGAEPLSLIEEQIIPALDTVGRDFESKKVYLPGLLISAEAAGRAFEAVRAAMPERRATGYPVVLATVRGDIHDIGKNIVKLLLENYGFPVYDLGRDVTTAAIVAKTLEKEAPLVVLSALMTTTVPAMAETVAAVHKEAPFARVMVGGAVLTPEYAAAIGADYYAKDAMEAVRLATALKTK